MNKQKGFTIIELIVVIAIIAVLSAIVLVNVTQYIARGKDASIKGNMASMVTIAAAFYDNNSSSYLGLASDSAFAAGLVAIDGANGAGKPQKIEIIAGAFCIVAELNDSTNWCVDSTGFKGAGVYASCDVTLANCAP